MAGVYCPRCLTNVLIESDGKSCSNCGGTLIGAAEPPTLKSTEKKPPMRGRAKEAREAHNLEAAGSNPAPATLTIPEMNAAAAAGQPSVSKPTIHTNGRHATAPKTRTAPTRKPARKTPADSPKSVSKSKTPAKR